MSSTTSKHDAGRCRLLAGTLLIASLLLSPGLLFAQGYFGTVTGVLTDSSGAVLAHANVVLADQQKGFTFKTTSDDNGSYLFRAVPPGLYSVTAEMSGFEKTCAPNIRVNVNDNVTANVTLKVGASTQTVEVQAQAKGVDTEDAQTGQVVNRRFINDLPLISRNVVSLTSLAPGVTEMDEQCGADCTGTNFVSNGSRGSTSDILTDGASVTNSEPNGGITQATYLPSPEAVEEFKVQQTNFSAEYGFSGGSVVNMITRSGTNSFMEACTIFSATTAWTRTTGSPIGMVIPFRRYAETIMASPSAAPSSRTRHFSSWIMTAFARSGLATANAGVSLQI